MELTPLPPPPPHVPLSFKQGGGGEKIFSMGDRQREGERGRDREEKSSPVLFWQFLHPSLMLLFILLNAHVQKSFCAISTSSWGPLARLLSSLTTALFSSGVFKERSFLIWPSIITLNLFLSSAQWKCYAMIIILSFLYFSLLFRSLISVALFMEHGFPSWSHTIVCVHTFVYLNNNTTTTINVPWCIHTHTLFKTCIWMDEWSDFVKSDEMAVFIPVVCVILRGNGWWSWQFMLHIRMNLGLIFLPSLFTPLPCTPPPHPLRSHTHILPMMNSVVVGAPHARNDKLPSVNRSGLIFRCPLTTNFRDCNRLSIEDAAPGMLITFHPP